MATTTPRLHIARSKAPHADGTVYTYAYLRYEVWDPDKGRFQPKPLASLGRTDRLDEGRVDTLADFLKEWLRKDSSLPFDALRERFQAHEPTFRILCSKEFGLRWICEQAWDELGYKEVIEELVKASGRAFRVDLAIFAMVLAQIVTPDSKRAAARKTETDLFFPEGAELSEAHMYRAMDVLEAGYEKVEQKLAEALRAKGLETKLVRHDLTNVPCMIRYDDKERAAIEEERQASGRAERQAVVNDPPIRLRGKSKNKRDDLPQVSLEAIVNEHGLVIHHQVHPGNTSDQKVTTKSTEALQNLGYKDIVWAGDAGTNSVENREALRAARFDFVLGEGRARSSVVKKVLATPGRYQQHPENPELSYKCVQREAEEERKGRGKNQTEGPQRLYIVRRHKSQEAYDLRRIEGHVKKIEETLATGSEKEKEALLRSRSMKKYVKRDGRKKDAEGRAIGPVKLDTNAVSRAKTLAGKTVIGTDVLDSDPLERVTVYRDLVKVEHSFRVLKTDLRLGPIRHRRSDRINAHAMIAVMAFNIAAWLKLKTGESLGRLRELFDRVRVQKVAYGEAEYWERVELEEEHLAVLEKLGYDVPPKRFVVSVVPIPDST